MDRIRDPRLKDRVVTAEEAASWIQDGMTLGISGFTSAGDAKAVPLALVKRADTESFKVNLYTGASIGSGIDKLFTEKGIIRKRLPYQSDSTMRKGINNGDVLYTDIHLSHVAELVRNKAIDPIDYAIVEACLITEDGMIIPTTSGGNSQVFSNHAKNIIIELNIAHPLSMVGLHDFYDPGEQGKRQPHSLTKPSDRMGTVGIPYDADKVKGIVFTNLPDTPSAIVPPDEETNVMANHLFDFLRKEIVAGKLPEQLPTLQSGVGSVANAVLAGLLDSEFENLQLYSEVLQDAVFDLMDAGKVTFASTCAITLSEEKMKDVYSNFDKYRDRILLRPQEMSNNPEIIRRLGLISINAALEFDIYGNVNSTHVMGTHMMNGLGGSGDFARNARLGIFVTKSIAKGGKISSIVPFASHIDHTEHDVDVVVTEQGYADLRGLAPRERAERIINNCVHPMYRSQLWDYFTEALTRGGQTPHVIEKALSWHDNLRKYGTMQPEVEEKVEETK